MDLHTIHIQSRFYGKYVDVFKKITIFVISLGKDLLPESQSYHFLRKNDSCKCPFGH